MKETNILTSVKKLYIYITPYFPVLKMHSLQKVLGRLPLQAL